MITKINVKFQVFPQGNSFLYFSLIKKNILNKPIFIKVKNSKSKIRNSLKIEFGYLKFKTFFYINSIKKNQEFQTFIMPSGFALFILLSCTITLSFAGSGGIGSGGTGTGASGTAVKDVKIPDISTTNTTTKVRTVDPSSAVIVSPLPDELVALQKLPNFPGSIVLANPGASSMTFTVVPVLSLDTYTVLVKKSDGSYIFSTASPAVAANESSRVTVSGLLANTKYEYFIDFVINGTSYGSPVYTFQTARASGSSYKFSVIADSHLFTTQHNYPPRYVQTLKNILTDQSDFVVTLGDDFRSSNIPQPVNADNLKWLMVGHRPYHNIIGRTTPLFCVNGNHEWEEGWLLNGTNSSIPVQVASARLNYYANPRPNEFYTGNSLVEPNIPNGGLLENYYSWTWGDALYVVLDDYWYVKNVATPDDPEMGGNEQWNCTFGYDQFMWLKKTLSTSKAKFKFIFHHHMNCVGRGATELANLFEWGGFDSTGRNWAFDQYRQGWGNQSIHQMCVQYGVSVVFQGHDHLYANQQLDGVRYLTVPMPAYDGSLWPNATTNNFASFFKTGLVIGPSGHITVEVTPTAANVSYYRVGLPGETFVNRKIEDSFIIYSK